MFKVFVRDSFLISCQPRFSLKKRGIIFGSHNFVCLLYFSQDEYVNHLFFSYHISAMLWQNIQVWIRIPFVVVAKSINQHFAHFNSSFYTIFIDKLIFFIYSLLGYLVVQEQYSFKGVSLSSWNLLNRVKFLTWKLYHVKAMFGLTDHNGAQQNET